MAITKHAVVRTDNLGGTKNGEQLASVVFYKDSNPAEIDNGNIVVLGEKLGREAYKATAPKTGAAIEDLYVIAEEELFYDQTVAHYLTEWVNEAGKTIRAYSLDSKGGFSVTAEAFASGETPDVGKLVAFTNDDTKITVQAAGASDAATFGTILEKETVGFGEGKYTYYYIGLK